MNIIKNYILILLKLISRIIYKLIPIEFKQQINDDKIYPLTPNLSRLISKNTEKENFEYFKEHFEKSILFSKDEKIREYAIKNAIENDKKQENFYLEFGVYKGISANFFSKYLKKLYAFDSCEGLREDWQGKDKPKSTFNLDGKVPKLNTNVEMIVGFIQDTLDDFLKKHNPKINFLHLDMDTYSSTKYALERLKKYLVKDAIIIFDELYNYPGWKNGEFKALQEVFREDEYSYLAFNIVSQQVVIRVK